MEQQSEQLNKLELSQEQALKELEAFREGYRFMAQIVAEMKEIPQLPSEEPHDVNPLKKVEFPPEGGMLTYMGEHPYPYKGFPYIEFVDKIDILKKLGRAVLSGLYHSLKSRPRWVLAMLVPSLWITKDAVYSAIFTAHRLITRFKIKPDKYCFALRELYRAFSMERARESLKKRELRYMMRDSICMVLEFDNAYRFRFQDILEEVDQKAAKKDTVKELQRILKVMQSREIGQDISDTWKLGSLFVGIYLRIDKDMREILSDVLCELDYEKVRLSVEDQYWCRPRKDYRFGFIMKEQSKEQKIS